MNTSQVISSKDKQSYPIRGHFNCKSNEIIYVMTCNICNIQYVRETSNSMNCRCRGHESYIRTNKDHPVAIHYRSYSHTIDDYSITIVDQEKKNRRLRLEEAWMTTEHLNPQRPKWQMVIPTGNSLYTYTATKKILNWNGIPVTE